MNFTKAGSPPGSLLFVLTAIGGRCADHGDAPSPCGCGTVVADTNVLMFNKISATKLETHMARFRALGIASLLVAVALLALAGCASKQAVSTTAPQASIAASSAIPQSGHALVSITDTGFVPPVVTVTSGSKVIWTNDGTQIHSVTPDAGGPKTGKMKPKVSAMHQFTSAGTFSYHDSLHPDLKGKVIVK